MTCSVALTTYNGSRYLRELLDSIRDQSSPPDEVVVVDDCSSDGSFELVSRYIEENRLDGWRVFRNGTNQGWRANFRKAFRLCTGELIFPCDQDDVWLPNKLAEMETAMEEHPEIALLASNYAVMNEDRNEKIRLRGLERDDGAILRLPFRSPALTVLRPGCTYCVRKELLEMLESRDKSDAPHDAMLWAYAALDDALGLYARITMRYRRHTDSASAPEKALCRTRRMEEVRYDNDMLRFFLDVCRERGDKTKEKLLARQLRFSERRLAILQKGSPARMLAFQLLSAPRYPTIRNMMADDYVLLLKRQ